MIRSLYVSLIVSCLALSASLSNATACSPVAGSTPSIKEQLKNADAVFTGKITAVNSGVISVRVALVYKGRVAKEVSVEIPSSSAACGIDNMKKGRRIVVYGRDKAFDIVDPTAFYRPGFSFASSSLEGSHFGGLTRAEQRKLPKGQQPK
jgi:hypothetical protein